MSKDLQMSIWVLSRPITQLEVKVSEIRKKTQT